MWDWWFDAGQEEGSLGEDVVFNSLHKPECEGCVYRFNLLDTVGVVLQAHDIFRDSKIS